mmetsp:Transcript_18379/g.57835  ORF Transcript_18379/g.57835 Transcript_18379/m.57835 type:complete len:239 (+) Transcript_18379:445-1161(+)
MTARVKSDRRRRTPSLDTMKLVGLMSRWQMRKECRCATPAASCSQKRATRSEGRMSPALCLSFFTMKPCRLRSPKLSMTRTMLFSPWRVSWARAMLGCDVRFLMMHSSLSTERSWQTFLMEFFGMTFRAQVPKLGWLALSRARSAPAAAGIWSTMVYSPTPTFSSTLSFRLSSLWGMLSRTLPGRSHMNLFQATCRVFAICFFTTSTSWLIIAEAFWAMTSVRKIASCSLTSVRSSVP